MFLEVFPPEVSSVARRVRAEVRPQSRVNHLVSLDIRSVGEIFTAARHTALERLLARVDTNVTLEGRLLGELLRAVRKLTFVRFAPQMFF